MGALRGVLVGARFCVLMGEAVVGLAEVVQGMWHAWSLNVGLVNLSAAEMAGYLQITSNQLVNKNER